jgi:2',3'-cyclic-nucleotide 2'-phosphodiesterase
MRILFIGDVFASSGRRIVESRLPALREELGVGFVVCNAENAADGIGITSRIAKRLLNCGVDVITLGNHAHRQREVYPFLNTDQRIVRPANMATEAPGRGMVVHPATDGSRVAVVNLMGRLYLEPARSPFEVAPGLIAQAREQADHVLVDFHAEATSEKVAMGRLLAGSATAVIGTHTHVQTNDPTVLSGGTAYLTDAGMTGPHDSVIGVRADLILRRFVTGLPVRFEPGEGDVRLEGALIDCDSNGKATAISTVRVRESE